MNKSFSHPIEDVSKQTFWEGKSSVLTIGQTNAPYPINPISTENAALIMPKMRKEGYFHFYNAIANTDYHALRDTITQFQNDGILPIFAALYDEFWSLIQAIRPHCESILGKEWAWLPDMWAWHVTAGSRGWAAHRDRIDPCLEADGSPQSLTLWIPLTDASPTNGCIYLVPADWDEHYPAGPARSITDYQSIRALPAKAGDVLAWNQAVLHWGARSADDNTQPRISIAIEAQKTTIEPFRDILLNPNHVPTFQERKQLIGRQLLQYQHMYNLSEYYFNLGETWTKGN